MTRLSTQDQTLLQRFFTSRPIRKAYLFGLYAPLKSGRKSDIDLLVEFDHRISVGVDFFGYRLELEKLLKKKVGLVDTANVSPRVRPFIDRDKVLIYERG